MRKVCAVIVTYNRPELLCRCVKAILNQSYPIDVLIYDNHSSSNTMQVLMSNGITCDMVTYIYADTNSGGAGGFHNGLKMAYEKGYDDIILMDDDGYPAQQDTIERLIQSRTKVGDKAIINSLVVCDPKTLRLSFGVDRIYAGTEIQEKANNGLYYGQISPFNGTMISSLVVSLLGYPRKEYFVYGDETEYYLRAKKNKVLCVTDVNSIYYHPTTVMSIKKVLGFSIAVNNTPLWKTYCSARNRANYVKEYFGFISLVKLIIRQLIGVPFSKGSKLARIKMIFIGMRDGIKGDFSREIDLSK